MGDPFLILKIMEIFPVDKVIAPSDETRGGQRVFLPGRRFAGGAK